MISTIRFNRNNYPEFSNFWEEPFEIDGITYKTNEHWYQSQKATNAVDEEWVRISKTPGISKKRGRQIECRREWEVIKINVMWKGLKTKFSQHKYLNELLQSTGESDIIEETVWHDRYWGICICDKCDNRGENWLGRLLVQLRRELKEK